MNADHATRLRELADFHDRFAKAYKLVEDLESKMDTTSLNDLRYALRAVFDCVRAALDDDDERFNANYSVTMTALRIAWHDVVDITVKSFRVYLDVMGKKYTLDIVARHLDTKAAYGVIFRAEDKARDARENRAKREEIYQDITNDDLEVILGCYRNAIVAEPAMYSERKKEKRNLLLTLIGLIFGTIIVGNIVISSVS